MGDQDGQTVTDAASAGAAPEPTAVPAPPEPTVDPIDARIETKVQEALRKRDEEWGRRLQSETDKRVAPLQRRLTEAENRARALEGTLTNLPRFLGPDVEPEVVQRVQLAGAQARLGVYDQGRQAAQMEDRIQEVKRAVLQDAKEEAMTMGLQPDDPRLVYDLEAPDPKAFRMKFLESARKAIREDSEKNVDQKIADALGKTRRESGVDYHDTSGGAGGGKTFTRAQIKDRKFYVANKAEIDKAAKEGRIQ